MRGGILPGREACGAVFGKNIVLCGGSINHMHNDETTDVITVFDTEALDFHAVSVQGPRRMPSCLSAEAVLYGPLLVLIGGWTQKGLLKTVHVLNMKYKGDVFREHRAVGEAQAEPESDQDGRVLPSPLQRLLRFLTQGASGSEEFWGEEDMDDDVEEEEEVEDDDDDERVHGREQTEEEGEEEEMEVEAEGDEVRQREEEEQLDNDEDVERDNEKQ